MTESRIFTCPSCGHQATKYFPRCPACARWLEPEEVTVENHESDLVAADPITPAQSATEHEEDETPRIPTGLPEADRVLGGGISQGSALLFTGAPGVGKSTLLMQLAARVADSHGPVLYVSAEESLPQAAARARRIDAAHKELFILADNGLEETVAEMNRLECAIVVIDSLQLMRTRYSDTAPGTAVQVKEVSARLTELAKKRGVPILVAGQIIKTGKFAGPMSVPHLYDGVFNLDDATLPGFILLRVEKNRFGSKAEVGSFRMTARGIEEVPSPSAELLKGGGKGIIAVAMEGTKPIATEIQVGFLQRADLSEAIVGYPKDRLRLIQTILAGYRLEIPSGIALDVLGGYRINDPAADLAVAIATVFAARHTPAPTGWAAIGEVALDGRLIPPKDFVERYREIELLGIEQIIVPHAGSDSLPPSRRSQTYRARTLREALQIVGAIAEEKPDRARRPQRKSEATATPAVPSQPVADGDEEKHRRRHRLAERKAVIPPTAPTLQISPLPPEGAPSAPELLADEKASKTISDDSSDRPESIDEQTTPPPAPPASSAPSPLAQPPSPHSPARPEPDDGQGESHPTIPPREGPRPRGSRVADPDPDENASLQTRINELAFPSTKDPQPREPHAADPDPEQTTSLQTCTNEPQNPPPEKHRYFAEPPTPLPSTPPVPAPLALRHSPRAIALLPAAHALAKDRFDLTTDLLRRELKISVRIAHELFAMLAELELR